MSKLKNTGVIFGSDTDEEETVEQQKPVTQINDVTDSLSQYNYDWNDDGEVTLNLGSELLSRVSSMEDCINPLRFFNLYTVLLPNPNDFQDGPYPWTGSEPPSFEGPFVESSDDKFIVNYHENKIAFFGRPQSTYTSFVHHRETTSDPSIYPHKIWRGYKVKYEPPSNSVWNNKKLKFKLQLKSGGGGGSVTGTTVYTGQGANVQYGGIATYFRHYRGSTLIESEEVGTGISLPSDVDQDGSYNTIEASLTSENITIQPNDYFLIYVGEGGNGVSVGQNGLLQAGGLGTRSYDPPVVKFTGESGGGSNGGAGGGTYSPYIFDIEQQKNGIDFDSIGKSGESAPSGSEGGGGGCGCVAIEFVGYWGE